MGTLVSMLVTSVLQWLPSTFLLLSQSKCYIQTAAHDSDSDMYEWQECTDELSRQGFDIVRFTAEEMDDVSFQSRFRADIPFIKVVVGGRPVMQRALFWMGVLMNENTPIPEVSDIPFSLQKARFLGRTIEASYYFEATIEHVLAPDKPAIFMKPRGAAHVKSFPGHIIQDKGDLWITESNHVSEDTPVWISTVVDIKAEYRCYVHKNKVCGNKAICYNGNEDEYPINMDLVSEVVECFAEDSEEQVSAYAMDFFVNDRKETFLLEVNDGFSLGLYPTADNHLLTKQYVEMMITRWTDLIKKQ
jgi:hypothetical protein